MKGTTYQIEKGKSDCRFRPTHHRIPMNELVGKYWSNPAERCRRDPVSKSYWRIQWLIHHIRTSPEPTIFHSLISIDSSCQHREIKTTDAGEENSNNVEGILVPQVIQDNRNDDTRCVMNE